MIKLSILSTSAGGGREGRKWKDRGAAEEGHRLHTGRDGVPGHCRHLPRHGQSLQALPEVCRAHWEQGELAIHTIIQCGGSASRWCGSGSLFLFDPDPDPTYYFDADPDPTYYFDADPVNLANVRKDIILCVSGENLCRDCRVPVPDRYPFLFESLQFYFSLVLIGFVLQIAHWYVSRCINQVRLFLRNLHHLGGVK